MGTFRENISVGDSYIFTLNRRMQAGKAVGFKPEEFDGLPYLYFSIYDDEDYYNIEGSITHIKMNITGPIVITVDQIRDISMWLGYEMDILLRKIHQKNINSAIRRKITEQDDRKEWNDLTKEFERIIDGLADRFNRYI